MASPGLAAPLEPRKRSLSPKPRKQEVNPDLETERQAASFSSREMAFLLDGDVTGERTRAKERIRSLIPVKEAPFDKKDAVFASRRERFARNLRLHRCVNELAEKHKLKPEQKYVILEEVSEPLATGTHDLIFSGGIRSLGDEEQRRQWLPLCDRYEVIGAYAQTELGHGSNLRKLETTACYDPISEEFELHSPTLTSTKWWPGTLGACATHALVFAMLQMDGQSVGMHGFIVPIRDPATHKPLPSIQVGDIGPKLGMNTVDNGFLRLSHVRVPRRNMLCRHAQVTPEGKYIPAKSRQMNYGTMLLARVSYIANAQQQLAAATTIATRYAAVRHQGGSIHGEMKILDWRTHQRKLLPTIATVYCFHYAGIALRAMHNKIMRGDYSEIGAVHIIVSAVKTMCTSMASAGMELCRRSCGGHGYSLSSGIPERWATFTHTTTAEGDNTIMSLQVAKGVIKLLGAEAVAHLRDPTATLAEPCLGSNVHDFKNVPEVLIHCLRHRACRLSVELAASQQQRHLSSQNDDDVWNADLPFAERVGAAHAELVMAELFVNGLNGDKKVTAELRPILQRLCQLFVLNLIEQSLGDLLEDGYMMGKAVLVRKAIDELITDLRPEAVALVDSFNLSDYSLESCIGRYDGQVYDALWQHALKATEYLCDSGPDGVVDGWREGIAPTTSPQARL
mmetsp:Transcript_31887/g.58770  ORF Transcript_31887/g.58770 Transcript_31887/m.58770 type:complete len:680 (-) Transcript_31887:117-2156(-)